MHRKRLWKFSNCGMCAPLRKPAVLVGPPNVSGRPALAFAAGFQAGRRAGDPVVRPARTQRAADRCGTDLPAPRADHSARNRAGTQRGGRTPPRRARDGDRRGNSNDCSLLFAAADHGVFTENFQTRRCESSRKQRRYCWRACAAWPWTLRSWRCRCEIANLKRGRC